MYILITLSRGSDDLSFGFDRSRVRRKQELTNKEKGKYYVTIMLEDIFPSLNIKKKELTDSDTD